MRPAATAQATGDPVYHRPRREQHIRAARAAELGLVDMLDSSAADDPRLMARALWALPTRLRPSQRGVDIDLNGLETIGRLVSLYIDEDVIPLHTAAQM